MRWLKTVAVVFVVGFSLACTDGLQAVSSPTPDPEPVAANETEEQKAARIAEAIAAAPDKAALLLKAEGMSAADFEKLLFAIASDQNRSKAFQTARKTP